MYYRFKALASIPMWLALGVSSRAQDHAHQQRAATEKLGTVHFVTSCAPTTVEPFDRAVALLHSFEFGPAISAFNGVLAQDSTCAMAYWGLAMSRWQNPFTLSTRSPQQLRPGQDAATRAQDLGTRASDRERGYITAVSELYKHPEQVPQRDRIVSYASSMRALVDAQPADTEARIFYALSLAASAPPTDKTYANQLEAGSILEPIFAKEPNHPGLAHYLIHTYDVPALSPKADAAAHRYAAIAPDAAHALHMPSHTFTRVGSWRESIATNQRAIQVAQREGSYGEALHASDYMMYAYLQLAQDSAAKAVLERVPALQAKFDVNAIGAGGSGGAGTFALAAIPARYAIERRDWRAAAEIEPKTSTDAWTDAMSHFVRALGAAHVGDLPNARVSIDSLGAIHDRLVKAGEGYWGEQVAIQQLGAQAWLAMAEHRSDDGLRLMRQAAAREDATEKSAVTPGPLAPARELLGDMLMELNQPAAALPEYEATLTHEPNRFRSLFGAFKGAQSSGNSTKTAKYRSDLQTLCAGADRPGRPELKEIRAN